MRRRNFVKLSSATALSVLFNQLTYSHSLSSLITKPDEVWAQADNQWVRLKANGHIYTHRDIEVILKNDDAGTTAVVVQSPTMLLNAIRLNWRYQTPATVKVLGDHWERSYGDLGWKTAAAKTKNPWYVLLQDGQHTAGFGVKTGCNAICFWNVGHDRMELTLDTRSGGQGVKLGTRKLHAADIITSKSRSGETPFAFHQRFCRLMCPVSRLPKLPVYGINDWYFAYGNNSAKLITEQAELMSPLATDTNNRPFSVIDAGWAAYSPALPGDCCWQDDFFRPNDKFKDMHQVANDLRKMGMRPGLWTRPLCASYKDAGSLLLPVIVGRDTPKNPILDPTIEENLERIKRNITIYKEWGYELVKHDFTTYDITGKWGFQMQDSITPAGWHFYDQTKTTAEVINQLYHTIRKAAGDMYLIGCNTMSHLSAGVFELNRIGDDTSGKEWDRTRKMGVNTLGFRIAQHDVFYATDGDCVGLTRDVPWGKNKQWMQLLAESGTPLFISAQPDALGEEQKLFIKKCFAQAAQKQPIGRPLDWLTNQRPEQWELDGRVVSFDWG